MRPSASPVAIDENEAAAAVHSVDEIAYRGARRFFSLHRAKFNEAGGRARQRRANEILSDASAGHRATDVIGECPRADERRIADAARTLVHDASGRRRCCKIAVAIARDGAHRAELRIRCIGMVERGLVLSLRPSELRDAFLRSKIVFAFERRTAALARSARRPRRQAAHGRSSP